MPERHYELFPKALGEVLEKYHVSELHLTLAQGFWQHKKWGYAADGAPPGAELWVWFKERTEKLVKQIFVCVSRKKKNGMLWHVFVFSIDQQWTDLINVLSGMFCASLNFMDSTNTIVPRHSFRPHGATNYIYDRYRPLI